ncbi:hypothetical protein NP233_g8760 [Leucocoprinus birnbaumii]|uniref:Uncharacterized protein n=1 Tax=Leucocoprinus birnbaumii TaxID=56174 RepID=A0AAD5VNF0_9AGAR|nr:hypothetical protein NP233_g8760 [Leucocoprinus birnbaumii]
MSAPRLNAPQVTSSPELVRGDGGGIKRALSSSTDSSCCTSGSEVALKRARVDGGRYYAHGMSGNDPIEAGSSGSAVMIEDWAESVEQNQSNWSPPQPSVHESDLDDLNEQMELESTKTKQLGPARPAREPEQDTRKAWRADVAHVLNGDLPEEYYARLERSWGLDIHQLKFCIHTPRNVFFLNPTMHVSFDNTSWNILPEREVLDDIDEHFDQPDVLFDKYYKDVKLWTYRFYVKEQRYLPAFAFWSAYPELAVEVKEWPYTGMTFISHISPLFVIAEVGSKLSHEEHASAWSRKSRVPNHLKEVAPEFRKVSTIAKDWLGKWMPPLRCSTIAVSTPIGQITQALQDS